MGPGSVRGEQPGDHAGQDAVQEVVGAFGSGDQVLHCGSQVRVLARCYNCAEEFGLSLSPGGGVRADRTLGAYESADEPIDHRDDLHLGPRWNGDVLEDLEGVFEVVDCVWAQSGDAGRDPCCVFGLYNGRSPAPERLLEIEARRTHLQGSPNFEGCNGGSNRGREGAHRPGECLTRPMSV